MASSYPFRKPRPKPSLPPQPSGPLPLGAQTLHGSMTRVVFEKAEEGFKIARFVPDATEGGATKGVEMVITGSLQGVMAGESLEITGQWSNNPKYGAQFAVESYKQVPPATVEGVTAFLGSGMIPGIGKEFAARIVKAFGEKTLEVIDKNPERLSEVEGIGPVRFERITKGWAEHREIANIMSFLQSYAISSTWASKIYRHYGNDAVRVMRENPYRLAIDLRGMGFLSADKIAQSAGIAHDSPERVQAAVLHLLGEAAGDGHTFFPFDELGGKALEMLKIDDPLMVRKAVATLCREEPRAHLVAEKLPEGDKAVYLKGLHFSETNVAEYLKALMATGKTIRRIDARGQVEKFERDSRLELAPQQRDAVAMALKGGVVVLTGGPGTGKTTTIRAIIASMRNEMISIALAAPTGRAAKRMSEATGMEATTIHRLLKYDPKRGGFTYDQNTPLPVDYVVIDEASMLDISLTYNLLKAIPPTASLLLVGDVDQLPSVGPGNVLRDLIDSGVFPVVRLETIFRQAQQSLIVRNAHLVNHGEFPILPSLEKPDAEESGRKPDFLFFKREEPEAAAEAIEQIVRDIVPRKYGFDPVRDIQVITPMHRGVLGAMNLNRRLQAALNSSTQTLERGSLSVKAGDKVMQCENDYDRDVYNGDIGVVTAIDRVDYFVRVRFDNRIVEYQSTDLDELTLSYAITVHKSQGSEYPVVVLPIHTQHFVMLQRNLFYTAVTRGKKLVVCVGSAKAISMAIKNAQLAKRYSGLRQRLVAGKQ